MLSLVQQTPFAKKSALLPGMEVGIYQFGHKFGEHVIMDCEADESKQAWKVRLRSLIWPAETTELYFTPDPYSEDWLLVHDPGLSYTAPDKSGHTTVIRPLKTS